MVRTTPWIALALSSLMLVACGEDSSEQTGGGPGSGYGTNDAGGDSSQGTDAADQDTAAPQQDAEVPQQDASVGECLCTPMTIPFEADGGDFAQVSIVLSPADNECTLHTGYVPSETIVVDDDGGPLLTASFGQGWTPSNASTGTLMDMDAYWAWDGITRGSPVSVTVTHGEGTMADVSFTVGEPFTSLTIESACFR